MAYYSIRPSVPGPFFIYVDGSPLTRDRLVTAVRQALAQAGVDTSHYSGDSFRVGAASTAAQAVLSDATVKMLGCWQSEAYQGCIRTPKKKSNSCFDTPGQSSSSVLYFMWVWEYSVVVGLDVWQWWYMLNALLRSENFLTGFRPVDLARKGIACMSVIDSSRDHLLQAPSGFRMSSHQLFLHISSTGG